MKNINMKEFQINKSTLRDLTPRELDSVAGGTGGTSDTGITVTTPLTTVTLTTLTNQRH